MGFALWVEKDAGEAWAQGTHEYKPMGAAVIALSDQFRQRDFSNRRRCPPRVARGYVGLFASIGDLNAYLKRVRQQS